MKLGRLVNSKDALIAFQKKSLPINIAWDLKKFIFKSSDEMKAFDELRNKWITERGESKIIDGKEMIELSKDKMPEFITAMNEILDKEIEAVIPVIKIDELLSYTDKDGKKIEMSSEELSILDWLIVE